MKHVVEKIIIDPRYLANIEYGEPRDGHPEGKVKYHIQELEENLKKLSPKLDDVSYWKLMFLIHVHDTFKAEAVPNSRIESPNSHASLARAFASEFIEDEDLLNMIQFHDVNFSLWKQSNLSGTYDEGRLIRLLETIQDWDLFLVFLIIDGCTKGKDPDKLRWFIGEVRKYKQTNVDESWLL